MFSFVKGNMDGNQTSYCTVLDKKSRTKYLLYTRRTNGISSICLTDAVHVWSSEFTEERQKQSRHTFALKSAEDYILKLRSACVSGDVSVVVQDTSVELHAGSSPGDLSVTLSRLEGPQVIEELRELLFKMADSLTQPESASPSVSPVKSHQRPPTGFEPRQQQGCAPSVTVKRRLAGTSLINPGTKKKLKATGVAFDDADEV